MFSIFDQDKGDFLATGSNSETKEECMEAFLHYREPDLGEWWECDRETAPEFYDYFKGCPHNIFDERYDEFFQMWAKEVPTTERGRLLVMQDMEACNFELTEHEKTDR